MPNELERIKEFAKNNLGGQVVICGGAKKNSEPKPDRVDMNKFHAEQCSKSEKIAEEKLNKLRDALKWTLFHIETRLRHRKDLFTDDERDNIRRAIKESE